MQSKLPWLCAVILGAIGFLVGFSAGGNGSADGALPASAALRTLPAGASAETPAVDPGTVADANDFERSAAAILKDNNRLRQGHRLFQMIERLSVAEMPGALNTAMHLDPKKRFLLVRGLLFHWNEFDPRAAVQYASAFSNDQQYGELKSDLIRAWAGKDFDAASQYALVLAPGNDRHNALGDAAVALAKTDPIRALKFFEDNVKEAASKGREVTTNFLAWIARQWTLKDSDAAANYVLTIKNLETRRDVLRSLSNLHPNKSPQDVLNWAKDIPDLESRDTISRTAFESWSRKDPKAMLDYASTLEPGKVRQDAVNQGLDELAKRDIGGATEYVKSLSDVGLRALAINKLVSQIAKSDSKQAFAIANLLPEGKDRGIALQRIGLEWARQDPNEAAEYFLQHPSGDDNDALVNAVGSWAENEPHEALAWLDKLPEGREKNRATALALERMASDDPQAAAAAALKLSGEAQLGAITRIADGWAWKDPAAASVWAESLPEGDSRAGAISGVIGGWFNKDFAGAEKWLGSLPDGKSRDAAVREFCDRTVAERDPGDAVKWASSISDEAARSNMLENVARGWIKKDRAAANVWLKTTNLLSEEIRRRLLVGTP